jgi:endogenous inhibitor of DNA gyrase (YacG/DUF329 family)
MVQIIGEYLGGPYFGIIIAVIVVAVAITFRLYMMRQGGMHGKCPKCGVVFDASRSFSMFHLGPLRQVKCPACGKTSLMNTYVKDPLTWPPANKEFTQTQYQLSDQELEQKHIEESKYEKV